MCSPVVRSSAATWTGRRRTDGQVGAAQVAVAQRVGGAFERQTLELEHFQIWEKTQDGEWVNWVSKFKASVLLKLHWKIMN